MTRTEPAELRFLQSVGVAAQAATADLAARQRAFLPRQVEELGGTGCASPARYDRKVLLVFGIAC